MLKTHGEFPAGMKCAGPLLPMGLEGPLSSVVFLLTPYFSSWMVEVCELVVGALSAVCRPLNTAARVRRRRRVRVRTRRLTARKVRATRARWWVEAGLNSPGSGTPAAAPSTDAALGPRGVPHNSWPMRPFLGCAA